MKILALEQELPQANNEDFMRFAEEEARQVWDLYRSGEIRELYFRSDRRTAVLVLECDSTAEADNILARLPYVREGLILFELIPLEAYSGFSRLFVKRRAQDAEP